MRREEEEEVEIDEETDDEDANNVYEDDWFFSPKDLIYEDDIDDADFVPWTCILNSFVSFMFINIYLLHFQFFSFNCTVRRVSCNLEKKEYTWLSNEF